MLARGVVVLMLAVMVVEVVMGDKCKMAEPPAAAALTDLFPRTSFDTAFANLWAPDHQLLSPDHLHVSLSLDKFSGTGFKSLSTYIHGLFSVAIKLPANNYTAGVVTSFYLSNADLYPKEHDEVDFEFLGRNFGEEYILQTNIYANGSTKTGREQRIRLWFDPTLEYHHYSILWTSKHIVLYIDDMPIREFPAAHLNGEYPSKQMYLYASIWDGSDWATDGGKYKVNYTYAPFMAHFSDFIVNGCRPKSTKVPTLKDPIITSKLDCDCGFSLLIPTKLTHYQRRSISWVQQKYMTYNYCDDKQRYPNSLPECSPPLNDEL